MSHRVAPSATRTPISRVRRDMRNDIMLYRPTDDSRHDTAAMIASVFAAKRNPTVLSSTTFSIVRTFSTG